MRRSAWLIAAAAVLALPAVALTANRIIQPDTGPMIRLVAFTPYALPAYAGCLLLLAVVLLRDPQARRRLVVVPTVCLALLTALHVGWLVPGLVGARPAVAGETTTVMSLNLRYGAADPEQVMELVDEHDVDVLVLLEVTGEAVAGLEAAGLGDRLPHTAGRPGDGAEGTMVHARDRISDVAGLDTSFDGWSMTVHLDGGNARLQAVHPAAPVGDARDWRADYGILAETQRADPADLMVGDFNATLDHRPLRELGLRDAAEEANRGWRATWPDNGTVDILGVPVPRLVAIDHVLLGDGATAVDVEQASVAGTDHRAVIVDLVM